MPNDRPESPEERLRDEFDQAIEETRLAFLHPTTSNIDHAVAEVKVVNDFIDSLRRRLSTPAGPSPERWELVQADDGPFIQERSPAPSPREEAVEAGNGHRVKLWAALKGYDAQYGKRSLREQHDLPPGCIQRIEAVVNAARPFSAARPSSPTPEETVRQEWRVCAADDGDSEADADGWDGGPWRQTRQEAELDAVEFREAPDPPYDRVWIAVRSVGSARPAPTPGDDATTKEGR